MIAVYNLAVELNTFDYYGWQAQVAAMGASEIVFDTSWPHNRRRFESIIAPGPAFLGLLSREKSGVKGEVEASSRFRHLAAFTRGLSFPRMKSTLPPGNAEFTVTLRNQTKAPWRNSDLPVWRQFAHEIGAVVIEDYDNVQIPLAERLALYAGARMNFGVACGPLTMCSLSEYPCVQFNWGHCWGNGFYEKAGIKRGAQMPWFKPNSQFCVWERDTLANIHEWFKRWNQNALHRHLSLGEEVRPQLC